MARMPTPTKLVSWNVNGLRAVLAKGFRDYLADEKPDVICLQEIKCTSDQVTYDLTGYEPFWNSAAKPGYSGTALFTRRAPLAVTTGMQLPAHDGEGRVLTAEFAAFYLVNVYTPNAQRELTRLAYRVNEWDVAFRKYVVKLAKKKPVIFCGDLNVAHKEIDLANPKSNQKNAGFTPEERASFDQHLAAGFFDTFRAFEPGPGHYSWWSQRPGVRAKNIGWRLDYFIASESLRDRLKAARIRSKVMGSDHCPVVLELKK
jgi:exodeoxyribonuclease-3